MTQASRLTAILEELAETGSVSVTELGERFGVSLATVRRDLQTLEDQRLVSRVHGGAVSRNVLYELPLRYKETRNQEAKQRIAAAIAARIEPGTTVGLTGGTTTTEVARAICEKPDLTIVTNALNIASELAIRSNLKLIVPGGVARSQSYELVGPMAEANLAAMNLDLVVVGVDGIDAAAGCTTHHEVEAYANRALIGRARRAVVAADASKLGKVAFARICGLEEVDELVTDEGAPRAELAPLTATGVALTTV